MAQRNARVAHVKATWSEWDARSLPLDDASVTRIITNLPFGKQIGTREENASLYTALAKEFKRLLTKDGLLVALTVFPSVRIAAAPADVVRRYLAEVIGLIEGWRLAEPGEFALRAFEHGKIDLTGVEGLADLIDAETAAQRRQALRQVGGALFAHYQGWRERLIAAMALMEAAIDFADEADVARDTVEKARTEAKALQGESGAHLDDGHRGELIRDGPQAVPAGPPTVGKSSLPNALARRDVATATEELERSRDNHDVDAANKQIGRKRKKGTGLSDAAQIGNAKKNDAGDGQRDSVRR